MRRLAAGRSCEVDRTAVIHRSASIINNRSIKNAITIGAFSHIKGEILTFRHGGKIVIGNYCFIGPNSYLWSAKMISIGNRVLISHNCNIFDSDTHPLDPADRHIQCKGIITGSYPVDINLQEEEVTIEDDVWIGANSTILKGVTIGKAAVVGAGSVVTKNVDAFTIVAGNPAKAVGRINRQRKGPMSWEEAVLWLRSQRDHERLVRDSFYDDPLIQAAERYYRSTEWEAVKKLLPSLRGKALDIGAGRGISSYALAREGWETIAIEPDTSTIVGAGAIKQLAKEADLKIEVKETWGEGLPFEDNAFDLVYCRQTLHHSSDLFRLCKEIGRVLKNGGTFIASREHVISQYADLPRFLEGHPLHDKYGGENAYLLREYLAAISNAGITLTSVLNPYASDINLFPETMNTIKSQLAKKLFFPLPSMIPDFLLALIGAFIGTPGRVYTFVGRK